MIDASCVAGAVVLAVILGFVAWIAVQNARHPPPSAADSLPKLLDAWRGTRSRGERSIVMLIILGTAFRRGAVPLAALAVIGGCITALSALCSAASVEALRVVRCMLQDLYEALGLKVRAQC